MTPGPPRLTSVTADEIAALVLDRIRLQARVVELEGDAESRARSDEAARVMAYNAVTWDDGDTTKDGPRPTAGNSRNIGDLTDPSTAVTGGDGL